MCPGDGVCGGSRRWSAEPNDSEALVLYSVYYIATGELKTALEILESAWKMDPFERNYQPWIRAEALFFAERYAEAIETLNAITEPINEINCMLARWTVAWWRWTGRPVKSPGL